MNAEAKGPFLVLEREGAFVQHWPLEKRLTSIGSSADCQVRLTSPDIRPLCGYVLYQMGSFRIRQLDARSGMLCNGSAPEQEVELHDGATIHIGKEILRFRESLHSQESSENRAQPFEGKSAQELRQILSETFGAVTRVLHRQNVEAALAEVAMATGKILHCDGVRLLVRSQTGGLWQTLASHPQGADPGRFSSSALRQAAEQGKTIALGQMDLAGMPPAESLLLNEIRSILCAPLDLSVDEGYLYMDRLAGHAPFDDADCQLFESLRGLFSELVEGVLRQERQRKEIELLQNAVQHKTGTHNILHASEVMEKVLEEAARVAATDVPVLVTGETGTGKELMARFLHDRSRSAQGPFVAINCGAIPETLMEGELFGHEKGAYTGAVTQRAGLIESAAGGTLFLDEIGELPLTLQVKLLRVLQQGEIVRLGGTQAIAVKFRLVTATHRTLKEEVAAGRFRADLFFRINVISLRLPALRERGRDCLLLANAFARRFAVQYGMGEKLLGASAEHALLRYDWPGNVRELENAMHKGVILSTGNLIQPQDMGLDVGSGESSPEQIPSSLTEGAPVGSLRAVRDRCEHQAITEALRQAKGNVSLTSRLLDVDRKVLIRTMERLGIRGDDHREA